MAPTNRDKWIVSAGASATWEPPAIGASSHVCPTILTDLLVTDYLRNLPEDSHPVASGVSLMKPAGSRVTMVNVQEQAEQKIEPVAEYPAADGGGVPAPLGELGGAGGAAKMYRRRSGRTIAGVAGGLADHLGV